MINEKQHYQDAGFREIRQDDGAGWRGGEVPGKVCFSCRQDDKDHFRAEQPESMALELEEEGLTWNLPSS